jgi:hypothetical protein
MSPGQVDGSGAAKQVPRGSHYYGDLPGSCLKLYFYKFFILKFEDGHGILEGWVYNTPMFWTLSYTWEGKIFQFSWSFKISFLKFFLKEN